MGLAISKLYNLFSYTQKTRVLMLGLDAAGKTTALYKLKLGELINTIPTIGFNVEQLKYKNLEMTIWDVGGQDKIRALWKHYYEGTDALIWLVDSNDPDRIEEARDGLHKVMAEDGLRRAVLLVLANKQDLKGAMKPDDLANRLGLHSLRHHNWYLQPCCASTGDGLFEGLDWMQRTLRKKASSAA